MILVLVSVILTFQCLCSCILYTNRGTVLALRTQHQHGAWSVYIIKTRRNIVCSLSTCLTKLLVLISSKTVMRKFKRFIWIVTKKMWQVVIFSEFSNQNTTKVWEHQHDMFSKIVIFWANNISSQGCIEKFPIACKT